MHIPDGFLDLSIVLIFFVLSLAVVGYSMRKVKLTPFFGVVAAAIFAAQMLNWPIPGGTSAHFVGGSLAAILLGPYAGCLAMTLVLTVQTLVFRDGGITAWGANVWNMAVVNVFAGYYIYRSIKNKKLAAFLAGWIGITLAAIFAGIQIGLSKVFIYGLSVTVPIMGLWHAILGIIEGVITAAVVSAVKPAEVEKPSKASLAIIAAMIALTPAFAYAAELVGYSEPLENAAEILGLEEEEIYSGLIPDYEIPGLGYAGVLVSGVIGVLAVIALSYIASYASRNRKVS